MAEWQPEFPRRKGRGSYPRLWLDDDSRDLLDLYRACRRESFAPPQENSLQTEVDALNGLLFESVSRGGPNSLRKLTKTPLVVSTILRESKHGKAYRQAMHRAINRLIAFIYGEGRAAELQEAISVGLSPRRTPRRWNELPRLVGGSNAVARRRPVLGSAELFTFIEAATAVSVDDPDRDGCLAVLHCLWGGLLKELAAIKIEDVAFLPEQDRGLWCAKIRVWRGDQWVAVPVAAEAYRYLRALCDREHAPGAHLFPSKEDRTKHSSCSTVQRIFRRALDAAGLPPCDSVTFRRAYANYLHALGLNDYEVRDAFRGLSMTAIDGRLQQHRWRDAQRRLGLGRPDVERDLTRDTKSPEAS